jgi:hypothetical protein
MVLPRGLTCANPLGKTVATKHTLAENAELMCSCSGFGMMAKVGSCSK